MRDHVVCSGFPITAGWRSQWNLRRGDRGWTGNCGIGSRETGACGFFGGVVENMLDLIESRRLAPALPTCLHVLVWRKCLEGHRLS